MSIAYLLAALFAAAAADNSYMILSPTSFRPGIPLNISVSILNASGPVKVTADLAFNNSGVIEVKATQSGTYSQGAPGTLLLDIPDGLGYGTYFLQVHGSGNGLSFRNKTYINFRRKGIAVFVQTDKATYKPGQTVNFRAVATYPNLTVYTGPMDIMISDPYSNIIKQWRGVQDASGVITKFMLMDTQPVLGNWKIEVFCKNQIETKYFEVKHYVLPKFSVSVELPSFILTSDTTLSGKVKATYTYGKPVKGTVSLRAQFDYWYGPYGYYGEMPMVTRHFAIDGEANFDIPLGHLSQILRSMNGRSIVIYANVTEEINGFTLSSSDRVRFHDQAENVEFLRSNPSNFKPGLPYVAYLKVSQHDGTPVVGKRQDIKLNTLIAYQLPKVDPTPYAWYYTDRNYKDLPDRTLTVPDNGLVVINFTAPYNATEITFTANYGSNSATLRIRRTFSPSDNYIQLMLNSKNIKAGQPANFEILSTEKITTAYYQVLSRGTVVTAGKIISNAFSVTTTPEMAPSARIIVYYVRTDGEIVTDSIGFDVDGVFLNEVSIGFDKTKAQPHENVSVLVTADPNSIVNLLAIDQSVLLLKSGNDITPSEVISELQNFDNIYTYNYGYDFYMARYFGGINAYEIFQNAGIFVMTDAALYQGHSYGRGNNYGGGINLVPGAIPTAQPALAGGHMPAPGQMQLQSVTRVRTEFSETWLWNSFAVGADGRVTVNTTLPDTITSWVASAFAVNSKTGLGVAPSTAKIEGFRPFFVSLNLPYSVVRGEQLALQANVFNYMTQDLTVLVTLQQSTCFKNIIIDTQGNEQYISQEQTDTIQVKAGAVKSVYFPIVPHCIGKTGITVKAQSTLAADAVMRQLLVEPEGIPKSVSYPVLVDLKNASSFSQDVPITFPAGVVNGSERVVINTIGDVLGPSMHNLHQLLYMPVGCGEQVMTKFAPDIFVTNYMVATNQLSGDMKDRALMYMEKGYQRELSYQHWDGSFSAFGRMDVNGSMWLTTFVVKSFHQAKRYIYIDESTLMQAVTWILNHQEKDGHFPEPGHVHSTYLQGGAHPGAGLTAFVLISLLETTDLEPNFQIRVNHAAAKAQAYLENQISSINDDYVLAITSYALKLANSTVFDSAFKKLNSHAIVQDGLKHWHRNVTQHNYWTPWIQQANPVDIEMTSYALLTHALTQDYVSAMPIMRWLTRQRNAFGGFASTQDTVIGLQALSEFAAKVYSPNTAIQTTISTDSFSANQTVDQANALVLQSIPLPDVPNKVSISATGHGFTLVDVSLSFHVEQELEVPSFDVQVGLLNETVDKLKVETCTKWLKSGSSGMAVQEFGIPTGFEADLESIAGSGVGQIKRTETENRKIVFYFDSISAKSVCLTLDAYRTGIVAKSQPAAVRVFDYYQPRNQVTKFYQSHTLENTGICTVCAYCGCPASK